MFLPLLTCVLNDEITSCTETTTLSDQKTLWYVSESSLELFFQISAEKALYIFCTKA